jgi:hypothetical protein
VGNLLSMEILTEVEVPHIFDVNRGAAPYIHVLFNLRSVCTTLCIRREIKVDSVKESLAKELAYLLDDLCSLFLVFIIIKLQGNYVDSV